MKLNHNVFTKIAAVFTLGGLGLLGAVSPAQAVVPSYTLDCNTTSMVEKILYTGAEDVISLTLANCTTFESFDSTGTVINSGLISNGPHTLARNDWYKFYNSGATNGFQVIVAPTFPQQNPAGTLISTRDITIPQTNARVFTLGAGNVDDEYELAEMSHCALSVDGAETHVYATLDFTVKQSGTYTFRGISSNPAGSFVTDSREYHPLEDPFLAVYQNFDPTQPDNGVIGCNDDLRNVRSYAEKYAVENIGGGLTAEVHQPFFTASLTPGDYTIVLTTYEAIPATVWATGRSGEFLAGDASTRVQLWGPAGSLIVEGETYELANTGRNSDPSLLIGAFALLGLGFVIRLVSRLAK